VIPPAVRLRRAGLAVGVVVLGLVAAGCELPTFGSRHPITEEGRHTLSLWQGFFLVACAVGLIVFGLLAYTIVRYRRRSDEIPSQRADNVKIEVVYMVTPVIIVAVLFGFSVATSHAIEASSKPDLVVDVTGYQWGWRFHYPGKDVTISGSGVQSDPVLVLPAHRTTRLVLRTADVNHSFWVPSFLQKRDLIKGVDNAIEITPTKVGSYDGRCAEFCGLDHWQMSFVLRVVPPAQLDAALARAQRGSRS
jgi:cytochrome c oxidase subunit 2